MCVLTETAVINREDKETVYTHLKQSADDIQFGRVENADDVFVKLQEELKTIKL